MRWFFLVYDVSMETKVIITEIAFEKDCSIHKATEIYEQYKAENRLPELLLLLKYHKEV